MFAKNTTDVRVCTSPDIIERTPAVKCGVNRGNRCKYQAFPKDEWVNGEEVSYCSTLRSDLKLEIAEP